MSPKILTVLLIVLCFAQYSRQDDAAAARLATTTVAAPVTYVAPRAWSADRNHDGVVDWRDGWRTTSALPVDWNRDGVVDWRDGWGWNGANAPARYPVDWNRDGLIDWRDDLAWNGAWGGYRGNWAPATEPVVTRKLGSNASTASTLRSKRRQDGLRAIGDHIVNFVAQYEPSDDELISMFEPDEDGLITVDEVYNKIHDFFPDISKAEIRQHFDDAGAIDGRIDIPTLRKAIAEARR